MNERELLQDCATALDTWVCTYAPEFCDESAVEAARKRIWDEGGTLGYIADLRQRIREALE